MDVLRTCANNEEVSFAYVSLDTTEGSCVGHWIWECSLFLPYIKEVQATLPHRLKIVLHDRKLYKTSILSDFDFHDDDIVYSTKMVSDPRGTGTSQESYVIPEEQNYILYLPQFFYLWKTNVQSSLFFECLARFRDHYIQKMPNITKSIPITYVARSRKENYADNYRKFINN